MTFDVAVSADTPTSERRGLLFMLCAPSGGGKGAIGTWLRQTAGLELSVSCTTRAPRPGETDGVDYHFIDHADFQAKIAAGDMLEHAEVFGQYYGTLRAPVEAALAAGRDMLFDIDWQGARQVRSALPDDVIDVFLLPPSMAALTARLHTRGQDSQEAIDARMIANREEVRHWDEFSYVVLNEDLETAKDQVMSILSAERLRASRNRESLAAQAARLEQEASEEAAG